MTVVRFGTGAFAELPDVLAEVDVRRPVLVTTERWAELVDARLVAGRFTGVRTHVPAETVEDAVGEAPDNLGEVHTLPEPLRQDRERDQASATG